MQQAIRIRHRTLFPGMLAGLCIAAWAALAAWGRSPYASYLDHASLDNGIGLGSGGLYVSGWVLMTVAMMLPTSLPLVRMFDRMVSRRTDHLRLVVLLIAGYLLIWTGFGVIAHAADIGVHALVDRAGWLARREHLVGAATLLGAGAFQFSKLKYRCLEECRSPFFFLNRHWSGSGRAAWASLRLGVRHGLFCVGCCWALMLLMFALGTGSLAWMLGLGAVMAVEKNASWGRELSGAVGGVLLAAGVYAAFGGLSV